MEQQRQYASEEQVAYARILDAGMKLGFVVVVVSFLLYVFGLVTPHVPVEQLPHYWTLSAQDYMAATNVPTGWGWLSLAGKGDYLNFIGIAILSLVTVVCYLRILPILVKGGDKAYTIIAGLEVLVLLLAASGVLVIGH
ncbi:MAG: hypothetical protein AB7U81_02375 [Thiohalomonadaceae bacterium]